MRGRRAQTHLFAIVIIAQAVQVEAVVLLHVTREGLPPVHRVLRRVHHHVLMTTPVVLSNKEHATHSCPSSRMTSMAHGEGREGARREQNEGLERCARRALAAGLRRHLDS